MITIELEVEQAKLVAFALMNVEAPFFETGPIMAKVMSQIEEDEDADEKALKQAVDALRQTEPTVVVAKAPEAPYGLRKDGKPRGRPGRPKKKK